MSSPSQPSERTAGLLIPAWTLRHKDDFGIGDIQALHQAIDWAAEAKIGFIQLLPLNETGSDHSPYNAISSIAFEPCLLDMADLPRLDESDLENARQELSSDLLQASHVHYPSVKATKRKLLQTAYQRFLKDPQNHDEQEAFSAFKQNQTNWLPDYCLYRWLQDIENGSEIWPDWNEAYNTPDKARDYLQEKLNDAPQETTQALDYYAWVQYHAFRQWANLRQHADQRGVQLMGDIPIGVSYYSADVFLQPQWFDLNWFGGAPPETFFKDDAFAIKWGQNWGVPLYNWDAIAQNDYRWWKRRIGKLSDLFHLFRIDHILGFYRIYSFPWHPKHNAEFLPLSKEDAAARCEGHLPGFLPRPDDSEKNKMLNRAHGHQHLSQILSHAKAAGAQIIGEDLGEVPDYVRPHLLENGIAGFNICHWLKDSEGHVIPGHQYDECTFATFATHDHDSLPAMWNQLLQDSQSSDEDSQTNAQDNLRLLSEFAGLSEPVTPYNADTKWALIKALLGTNSRYAALMISDLFDDLPEKESRYNIPGTTGPHNWTYRLPQTVSEFNTTEPLKKETQLLTQSLQKNSRG